MYLSVSSIMMSVLVTTILIILLQFFLINRSTYKKFKISFLTIISLFISLRLFLPVEFVFTHTFSSQKILPTIYAFSSINLMKSTLNFTFGHIIGMIWLLGSLVSLLKLAFNIYQDHRKFKLLKPLPLDYLLPEVRRQIPKRVTLRYLPIIFSPFTMGIFKPQIILPKILFGVKEQEYVIQHELAHIRNYDNLRQYLVEVLVCIYWWFPLIYLYRHQVYIIHDLYADWSVVKNKSKTDYCNYIDCLMNVLIILKQQKKSNYKLTYSRFAMNKSGSFNQRIDFLGVDYQVRRTSLFLSICLFLMPLLITSFVVKPSFSVQKDIEEAYQGSSDASYTYILKSGGRYHLIIDGKKSTQIKKKFCI